MRPRSTLPLTLVTLLLLMVVGSAGPAAADVTCTGTIGSQHIDDNVVVPGGASCTLDGTTVDGNVLVGPGATLTARFATIGGNVQDANNDAGNVVVTNSRVDGNIQLEQGTGATVTGTAVGGDLQLEANSGFLRAGGNDIGGNLQANQNGGGLTINSNTIDGNLQCQSNDPAPTGGGNVVGGSAEGQCANLTGAPTSPGTARETGRISGPSRYETSVAISQAAFPEGAPVVYLARADNFPDALAGGTLTNGPILLVPQCSALPDAVRQEIRRVDPQRVLALGGTAAICDAVLEAAGNA